MNEPAVTTPRWGNAGRDRKAMAILRTLIAQCGDQITDGEWLDIGCGSGGIAGALALHVRRVVGIDPEPWPSWERLAEERSNLSFLAGRFDGDRLPLPKETADVVICNQVYEHVAHPMALVRNIHSVLKPGGVCYFAGPNLLWPIEPHVYWPLVHWLPRGASKRIMQALGSKQADALDAYSRSYWELLSWFREAGFHPEDAVPERLSVELGMRKHTTLENSVRHLPKSARKLLAPFWPSFIFVLHKHKLDE